MKSLAYIKKGRTPVQVLPAHNAYTTFEQTTCDFCFEKVCYAFIFTMVNTLIINVHRSLCKRPQNLEGADGAKIFKIHIITH